MINTRLILVDGIPGCGKSTTAQWLHQQLRNNGITSSWSFELDNNYPIRSLHSVKDTGIERMIYTGISDWKMFIESVIDSDNVTIMDSAIFQKTVLTLFDHNIDRTRILEYATKVESIISQLNPILIYFYPDPVDRHVIENNILRGDKFTTAIEKYIVNTPYAKSRNITGLEGQIRFWSEYQELCSELVANSSFRKLLINMSNQNWHEYQRNILNFLSIPKMYRSSIPAPDLTQYKGMYKDPDSELDCSVSAIREELSIHNLMSPLEQKSVLIHKRENTFTIRGASIDLEFKSHDDNTQMSILVTGSWNRLDGKTLTRVAL